MKSTRTYFLLTCLLLFATSALAETAILFENTFTKDRGVPTTYTETFIVPTGASDFQLLVSNGRGKDGDVKNAVITLNGVEVISVSDLRPEGSVQKVLTFNLLPVNELTVTLNGPAGNSVSVELTGTVPSAPDLDAPPAEIPPVIPPPFGAPGF